MQSCLLRRLLLLLPPVFVLSAAPMNWNREAARGRLEAANITTIYLVSSCHLDVGFANTAQNIVNEYFDKYFPSAIATAEELRRAGGEERLVFTTHPYLVWLYLNCSRVPQLGLHCPNASQVAAFNAAVERGDITWHAFPFNAELEFYDRSMAEFGFILTHGLDAHFRKTPTITMSQRDVPGTTRSLIPILVKNGVQAITVGVNTASMPPAVPTVFTWRDPVSSAEIIAMWHPHGYGGTSGPGLDSMVIVPGMPQALAFAIRGDNRGPPPATEVIRNYQILQKLFPEAKVVASGYDTFVNKLIKFKAELPVYTEEIGDMWIYGVPSDPWKTAASRTIFHERETCLLNGHCSMEDPRFRDFSSTFIKVGEHTWGKDVKTFLHDTTHWSNAEFHAAMGDANFKDMVSSWVEQRFWGVDYPVQLLGDHPLRRDITAALERLRFNGTISTSDYNQVPDTSQIFTYKNLQIGFSEHGGISHLVDQRQGGQGPFADKDHPLGQFVYQTYSQADYKTFFDEYIYDFSQGYIYLDLGKPGMNISKTMSVYPDVKSLWTKEDDDGLNFLVELQFDPSLVEDYGAPQAVWLYARLDNPSLELPQGIDLVVYVVNKTSTRIPESLSLYFHPLVHNASSMAVGKLGEWIRVLDVIKNGSRHLHASDNGVSYGEGLNFTAYDTSVVCIGRPMAFPTPVVEPDISLGFSFNIYNNVWGTNYVMWYPYLPEDKSSLYRFRMLLPNPTQCTQHT